MAAAELLSDPGTFVAGVPHEQFARLRREAPVAWVDEPPLRRTTASGASVALGGTGYWAVTRHATVVAASRAADVFSSAARGAFLADPRSRQELEQSRQLLVNMDAPDHARVRRFVAAAFGPRAIAELRQGIRAHARSLVDRLRGGAMFDAVADLAAELPVLALGDMLGVPAEDRPLLGRWSANLVGFDDPELGGGRIEVYKRTFTEALAYALEQVRARRRRPTADLLSELARAEVDGERLGERELCNLWLLLVVAGNESTRHLLSGAVLALLEWPDERRRLATGTGVVPGAVEELLRWVSPVMQFRRTATRDAELDGQRVRAGDKVVLYYASANRDEAVFAAPDRLDLARQPNPHLAFGVGPHFCLGAHLARLEAAELLEALLPDLDRLEQTGPAARLASNFMNGLKSLPVRLGAVGGRRVAS